jgi:hypothetical protein
MRESGQTIVEWLAVLAGVVTLAAGATVAMPTVAPAVSGGMHTAICDVIGGSCGAQAAPTAPASAASAAPAAPTAPAAQATPAPATTTAPAQQDLCGSSYFNVPELWFTPACASHDRCYGAHQGKAACDSAFLADMLAICAQLPASGGVNSSFSRASCRAAAHLYYKGVVIEGGFSYCHRAVCRPDE